MLPPATLAHRPAPYTYNLRHLGLGSAQLTGWSCAWRLREISTIVNTKIEGGLTNGVD